MLGTGVIIVNNNAAFLVQGTKSRGEQKSSQAIAVQLDKNYYEESRGAMGAWMKGIKIEDLELRIHRSRETFQVI